MSRAYTYTQPGGRRGKKSYLHRAVWAAAYGPIPDGCFIDHIDRDTTNNALSNLRLVTPAQNACNSAGRSPYGKGISYRKGRYRVQVRAGSVTVDKTFATIPEATAFAVATRNQLHGEYACHDTV